MKKYLKELIYKILMGFIDLCEKTGIERKYYFKIDDYRIFRTRIRIVHPIGFIAFICYFIWRGFKGVKDNFCIF